MMTIQSCGNRRSFPRPRCTCAIARLLVTAIVLCPLGSTAFAADEESPKVASHASPVCTQMTFSLAAHQMTGRSPSQFRSSIERAAVQLQQIDTTRHGLAALQNTNHRSVKSGALIGAAIGAGVGAVGGAIAGVRTGEERAPAYGAAVFAAVGALAGAAVGAIIGAARN